MEISVKHKLYLINLGMGLLSYIMFFICLLVAFFMGDGTLLHHDSTTRGNITAIVLGLLYLGGVAFINYRIMKDIDEGGRIQLMMKSFFFFIIAPLCGFLYYAFQIWIYN